MPHDATDDRHGERFLYWLAQAATEVREAAGTSPETLAAMLGVRVETVRRFENAQHWPRDAERLIAAYAIVGELKDPRVIYQRALDLWHKYGTRPLLGPERDDEISRSGAGDSLPMLRAQAKRLPPLRPTRSPKPTQRTSHATDVRHPSPRRRRA